MGNMIGTAEDDVIEDPSPSTPADGEKDEEPTFRRKSQISKDISMEVVSEDVEKVLMSRPPALSTLDQVEELAEQFFGVEGARRHETIEDIYAPSGEPLLLQMLDPYSKNWRVVPLRISCILAVYAASLAVTFNNYPVEIPLAVGIAAVCAPVLSRIGLFISEILVFNKAYLNKKKGQWPMVDWMSFTLFMDALYQTVKALLEQKNEGDPRDSELIRSNARIHDERSDARFEDDGTYFFDFVADTGDGFNPTFTVASLLGKRSLTVVEKHQDGKTKEVEVPRGRVCINGGDLCYPFTTYDNLFFRLFQPYSWAFPKEFSEGENMYFAAGNHEYMDNLKGFKEIVLPRKRIGGWNLPQQSSYFAITLPRGWVVFVLDIGKEPEDLDEYQMNWFNNYVEKMKEDEKIILLYHVPDWIKCGGMNFTNMKRLREWRAELGDKVRLVLTGDLHYFKVMEEEEENDVEVEVSTMESNCVTTEKKQYVIAGHGGAFNHATHYPYIPRVELMGEGGKFLKTTCEFPTPEDSKNIWREKWPFMFVNTTNHIYSRVLGAVYMVTFLAIYPQVYMTDTGEGQVTALALLSKVVLTVFFYFGVLWLLVTHHIMVTANFEINDFHKFVVSTTLIVSHSVAHIAQAFGFRIFIDWVLLEMLGKDLLHYSWSRTVGYCFCANLSQFLLGTMLAPFLTMIYFYLSIHIFNWHYNEAISMIQIEEFKGFMRIAIKENGDLDMYCIVTDSSPQEWTEVPENERTPEKPATLVSDKLDPYLLKKITLKKFKSKQV